MRNQDRNLLVTNIGMNRRQIRFIDGIAQEIRFSGSKKPSRGSIVRIFAKVAMLLKPDVSGIRSEKEFEERFFKLLAKKCKESRK